MRESARRVAIVAARNEDERIGATLDALRAALAGARLIVADDASEDATAETAMRRGAWVIRRGRPHGKGGNMAAAAEAAISEFPGETTVLLCDADLGESAATLVSLIEAVEGGACDLAVARFAEAKGSGLGFTLGYSRRARGGGPGGPGEGPPPRPRGGGPRAPGGAGAPPPRRGGGDGGARGPRPP